MGDKELLEKAAKAAGYEVDQRASFMTWRDSKRLALLNARGGHTLWNAEEDDGDALRHHPGSRNNRCCNSRWDLGSRR